MEKTDVHETARLRHDRRRLIGGESGERKERAHAVKLLEGRLIGWSIARGHFGTPLGTLAETSGDP